MLSYDAQGVRCEIRVPLPDRSLAGTGGPTTKPAAKDGHARSDAFRHRVLVVEDEPFVAMDIEAVLSDAGCVVIGPAQEFAAALDLARSAEIDLALLDANLGGYAVDEIAAELTRRQIPFLFASGYGREALPVAFREAPLLPKPFTEHQLMRSLRQLTEVDGNVLPMKPRAGGIRQITAGSSAD